MQAVCQCKSQYMKKDTGDSRRKLEGIIIEHILFTSKSELKVNLTSHILERENINKKSCYFELKFIYLIK